MCGIIGVANFEKSAIPDLSKFMRQGAIVGVLRGTDSTGMFTMDKDYKYNITKLPYSGEIFAESKAFKASLYDMQATGYTILHHRAATKGTVNLENAHPFIHESEEGNKLIIGVHNGTLDGHYFREDGIDFEVDSDYLFYKMMKEGADTALSTTPGAVASVWTERDAKLRLFANYGRPLHFGIIRNRNAMLIASEAEMLYWLARRNDIDLEDIVEVDKNIIHTFSMEGNVRDFETQAVEVPAPTNFTGKGTWGGRTTGAGRRTGTKGNTLASYGLVHGQELSFYPDDIVDTGSGVVRGYVDTGKDIMEAVMYNVSEAVANSLDHRLAEAVVKAVAVASVYDSSTKESTNLIVVSVPKSVTYGSAAPFEDMEDSVKGPSRPLTSSEYYDLTGGECVNCSVPIPHTDLNRVWVNEDRNVVCTTCAIEMTGGA